VCVCRILLNPAWDRDSPSCRKQYINFDACGSWLGLKEIMIFIAANYVISVRYIKVGETGNSLYFVTCLYPKWDCKRKKNLIVHIFGALWNGGDLTQQKYVNGNMKDWNCCNMYWLKSFRTYDFKTCMSLGIKSQFPAGWAFAGNLSGFSWMILN
jgi:hypothetical protein